MGKCRIVFATGNEGKMKEIRNILDGIGFPVLSMKEAGVSIDVEENGTTYSENALIKAKAVHDILPDAIVLADDSGLEIDYLNKEPGIYSARYLGYDTSYDIKNQIIIDKLKGVEDEKRTARFVCAIAAVLPDGEVLINEATMEGKVAYEIVGKNGFGYDPILWLDEFQCTSAELDPDQKDAISHRGKALRMTRASIVEKFGEK